MLASKTYKLAEVNTHCLQKSTPVHTLQNMEEKRDPQAIRFGRRLKAIRNQRGMTQQSLADASFMSRNYVGVLEIGKNMPSFDAITNLAKALGVSREELLGDDAEADELRRLREERERFEAATRSISEIAANMHGHSTATAHLSAGAPQSAARGGLFADEPARPDGSQERGDASPQHCQPQSG